jgi:hypothetical protein
MNFVGLRLFFGFSSLPVGRMRSQDGEVAWRFLAPHGILSNVPESMESCRFKIRGFAGSSDRFSFRMSSSVSSFFLMKPNESGAHQT